MSYANLSFDISSSNTTSLNSTACLIIANLHLHLLSCCIWCIIF